MIKLRSILIFWTIVFAARIAYATDTDTSIFFRYASTFDQLIPSPYYPASVPDSASLEVFNFSPKNASVTKKMSSTFMSDHEMREENNGAVRYTWDAEGRVGAYQEFWAGDTIAHLNVKFRFLIRQSMNEVVVTSGSNLDTTSYQYNRSGWVGTWRHHVLRVDTTYIANGTRMYDSRGKLIVATNIFYGPLAGTYTFEYDKEGRLVRRSFLAGGTGVVLCTDTLEYIHVSELVMIINHKLKVAGSEWRKLESKTLVPFSNHIISYSDFNDADTNYFYRNLPSYTIQYDYDEKLRIVSEKFGTDIDPAIITANYYYGKYNQPDSIVYTERFVDKKVEVKQVYSRDIRNYDSAGRITDRTVTTYLFEEKKKKDKMVPRETVFIQYQWQ